MFCMFPDSKSEWKKWATGQSVIREEITSYRIGTLTYQIYSSKGPLEFEFQFRHATQTSIYNSGQKGILTFALASLLTYFDWWSKFCLILKAKPETQILNMDSRV